MRKLKITELNRITAEEFKAAEKLPLVVVLDHVRSLYNVGSVFRSKTALGAEDTVDWKYYAHTQDAVCNLKSAGWEVWTVEQVEGSVMLQDFEPEKGKKYAIVLGNEVKGVQQEVVDQCDGCIEIPQFGTKHSLNVSVTAGILIWDFACKLKL